MEPPIQPDFRNAISENTQPITLRAPALRVEPGARRGGGGTYPGSTEHQTTLVATPRMRQRHERTQ